jgi:hypothetical protein
MTNPWDPFPFPSFGDPFESRTFKGVGEVMTNWESIEFELGRLYSLFVGDPDGASIQQEYGAGRIFRDRLGLLRSKAPPFFVKHPCQQSEGAFDLLTTAAEGFSERRNEVAHGLVIRIDTITLLRSRLRPSFGGRHYALIPPIYCLRFHTDGAPDYAYTSAELSVLSRRLFGLGFGLAKLRGELFAKHLRLAGRP